MNRGDKVRIPGYGGKAMYGVIVEELGEFARYPNCYGVKIDNTDKIYHYDAIQMTLVVSKKTAWILLHRNGDMAYATDGSGRVFDTKANALKFIDRSCIDWLQTQPVEVVIPSLPCICPTCKQGIVLKTEENLP